MNEKAIELIKEAIIHASMINSNSRKPKLVFERSSRLVGYGGLKGILHYILAELAKQPVCKTCGGSERKPCSFCRGSGYLPNSNECDVYKGNGEIPCPDCKQPEAGTSDAVKILEKRYGTSVAQIAIEQESRIDQLEAEARWIPVSERPPEKKQRIWVVNMAREDFRSLAFENLPGQVEHIRQQYTHWKPIILPERALKER